MLVPVQDLYASTLVYLPKIKKVNFVVYWLILILTITILALLPFLHTDISISAQGITRPVNERTEVKSVVSGIIDTIFYREGDFLKRGQIILRIKDPVTKGKRIYNNYEIDQHKKYIHDVQLLTSHPLNEQLLLQLTSPLYREQLSRFLHLKADQDVNLKKATSELSTNKKLFDDKVITQKEFFDTQVTFDKVVANAKAFEIEQQGNWQQDLARYSLELSQYKEERNQVNSNANYYEIKAPVSGTIQGINTRYAGGLLQANESLCTLSPDGNVIAECYVSASNIGLIKQNQPVRFQIDAFDYKYFGTLTGRVMSIENDFSTINNGTFFKVRCLFDAHQLRLKNGYIGHLQKGLTFQARFIVGTRSFWQLLWDNISDWLNPQAVEEQQIVNRSISS